MSATKNKRHNHAIEEDLTAESVLNDLMDQWALASESGDVSAVKRHIETLIRFLSSPTILIKLAADVVEVEAIRNALHVQLSDAKETLRMLNHSTTFAY